MYADVCVHVCMCLCMCPNRMPHAKANTLQHAQTYTYTRLHITHTNVQHASNRLYVSKVPAMYGIYSFPGPDVLGLEPIHLYRLFQRQKGFPHSLNQTQTLCFFPIIKCYIYLSQTDVDWINIICDCTDRYKNTVYVDNLCLYYKYNVMQ